MSLSMRAVKECAIDAEGLSADLPSWFRGVFNEEQTAMAVVPFLKVLIFLTLPYKFCYVNQ